MNFVHNSFLEKYKIFASKASINSYFYSLLLTDSQVTGEQLEELLYQTLTSFLWWSPLLYQNNQNTLETLFSHHIIVFKGTIQSFYSAVEGIKKDHSGLWPSHWINQSRFVTICKSYIHNILFKRYHTVLNYYNIYLS